MAKALKGAVPLKLSDGRTLTVEYDFEGLIALEEAAGMRMPAIYQELTRVEREDTVPSMRLQRAIIFGGLQSHHPEITLKEAGDIILKEAAAIEKAYKALKGAHGPEGEEAPPGDGEADPPLSKAGTGGDS